VDGVETADDEVDEVAEALVAEETRSEGREFEDVSGCLGECLGSVA